MPTDNPTIRPSVYLVSGCLLGLVCRYDGRVKEYPECRRELVGKIYVPVCPEQLGGLPTPREPADLLAMSEP